MYNAHEEWKFLCTCYRCCRRHATCDRTRAPRTTNPCGRPDWHRRLRRVIIVGRRSYRRPHRHLRHRISSVVLVAGGDLRSPKVSNGHGPGRVAELRVVGLRFQAPPRKPVMWEYTSHLCSCCNSPLWPWAPELRQPWLPGSLPTPQGWTVSPRSQGSASSRRQLLCLDQVLCAAVLAL